VNTESAEGDAERVTNAFSTKSNVHVEPQSMPTGLEDTVPEPVPDLVTVNERSGSNVAVIALASVMVTWHAPAPLQAPPHPVKTEPDCGATVSVTTVPTAKSALHVAPQLIPAGLDVTEPLPEPSLVTLSAAAGSKVTVTYVAALIVTEHGPLPLHAPDHDVNTDPALGVAVNVTLEPATKSAVQPLPQSIPTGLEETEPLPSPAFWI